MAMFDEAFQMYAGDLSKQRPVSRVTFCDVCGTEHLKSEACPRCNPSTKDTRCCKCLNAEGSTVWGMDGSLICGSCLDEFVRDGDEG